jgi:hypothetical protein
MVFFTFIFKCVFSRFIRCIPLCACACAVVFPLQIGLTPTACAQSSWIGRPSGTTEFLKAAAFGGGNYVVVGENGVVLTSVDGVTWSGRNSGTSADLSGVVYGGGQFVAVGGGGRVLTSADGSLWTPRSSGTPTLLSSIAYGAGRYVAVGGGGVILSSIDGNAWSPVNPLTSQFLERVAFAAGQFIAVGGSGEIWRSADGLAWVSGNSPSGVVLTGIAHFAGKYFVSGQSGTLLSSVDAATWSFENSGSLSGIRGMATDGTQVIAVGEGGTIRKSSDGASWAALSSGVAVILDDAIYANGQFLAIGEPNLNVGTILAAQRDPGVSWAAENVTVSEAAGSVTLTIERSGTLANVASVQYASAGTSATAGVDYSAPAGVASFGIGEATAELVIPITNNPEAEPQEAFEVVLENPSPIGLLLHAPSIVTVTIVDAQDSDGDGLPDMWEIEHFGNVLAFGPDDDPDGDGNSNQRELNDGTDPMNEISAAYTLAVAVGSGSGNVSVDPLLPIYSPGQLVTLTPVANGSYSFSAWSGDVAGSASPLQLTMGGDRTIAAHFAISLASALDGDGFEWVTSGSGAAWIGQDMVTADGIDAARAGGLTVGQKSSLEAVVHGPATVTFRWKIATNGFDSLRFFIDASPRATVKGVFDWDGKSFLVGAGTHLLKWEYARNSSLSGGTNEAWLDQVFASYAYEDWKLAYFTAAEQAEPAISGPLADPDGDGVINMREFVHGANPRKNDGDASGLAIELGRTLIDGESHTTMTWRQHANRASFVLVTPEVSDTLEPASWNPMAASPVTLSELDAIQTIRITDPQSNPPRRFYRLLYSPAP